MRKNLQFSLRIENELLKEASRQYLMKRQLKTITTKLWLQGKLTEEQLKRVLSCEEIKDVKFGKKTDRDNYK